MVTFRQRVDVATSSVLTEMFDFVGSKNIHEIIRIEMDDERVVYHSKSGAAFWLPAGDVGETRETAPRAVVSAGLMNFVNGGTPIMKFILAKNGRIRRIANVTVDILPRRGDDIYLILRQDGGWAVPGGFVDAGETPVEAAQREFEEETSPFTEPGAESGTPYRLEPMHGVEHGYALPASIMADDPREKYSWTWPFVAWCSPGLQLSRGSDAVEGRWYAATNYPNNLTFPHHHKIISMGIR